MHGRSFLTALAIAPSGWVRGMYPSATCRTRARWCDAAVRVCRVMEPSAPFFVEEPVREGHALMHIHTLRQTTTVPLTLDLAPLTRIGEVTNRHTRCDRQ